MALDRSCMSYDGLNLEKITVGEIPYSVGVHSVTDINTRNMDKKNPTSLIIESRINFKNLVQCVTFKIMRK
jgi:hypothetical protein